nr:calcium-activated chloride channel regulator 2 [Cavia porcellus]
MNRRLLYNMTHRDNVSLLCSLRFVTLLVALSPELVFLGAGVQLRDNGYDGLLVAINPWVPENQNLIPNIKEMITEASFYLFNATKRRVFFRNIQILIPATWKANNYSKVKQESYEKANVIVTDWKGVDGDDPHTLQYRGCGREGKYIHFTSNFLLNDDLITGYGSRGRVFVHEWAHLRWGVFDEYNNDKPFYLDGQNKIKATRCSSDIAGTFVCEKGPCPHENCIISKLFKEGCTFLYNSTQNATASIMFMQSLSSVVEFCNTSTHNQEAPNLQNQMCSLRSAWDVITDSPDFSHSIPMNGTELPPPPMFSVVQDGDKVVCLVLDVSSKMAETLRQGCLMITYPIVTVMDTYEHIKAIQTGKVPKHKQTGSGMEGDKRCDGERRGLNWERAWSVVEKLNGKASGSVMILVTSGADQHISNCLPTVLSSGATIHSIAMGSSEAEKVEELAHRTGGLKFYVPDKSNANMIDAFSRISSGTGDIFQQTIQLESMSENVKPHHQLKNTVTVDNSVGNDTIFLVTWQISDPPEIVLVDPTGKKYYTNNFTTSLASRTASLCIPGTAKPGHWAYSLNNTHHSPRALTVTVASRASSSAVPPATVEVFVEKDSVHFPDPVTIYANVRRGFYPILNATVTAIIEPGSGDPVMLKLFDDGAGADVIKNDGIYSRYFFSFAVNGRYSLKVYVSRSASISTLVHSIAGSHAMYVPGYITNGNIQMNAPKKSAHRSEEEQKCGFNRVSSGGSFSVQGVPEGSHADIFPPCKIIDLEAVKVEEEVTLSWTAPGEDFDQGQATSYEIRISISLQNIQDDFNNAILVNTSKLHPKQAGSKEIFKFSPRFFANGLEPQSEREIQENHRIYVAIRAMDRNSLKSAVSNIVQVSLPSPPKSASVPGRDHLILKGVLTAMSLIGIICLVITVTHYILNKKKCSHERQWDKIAMNKCTEYLPS